MSGHDLPREDLVSGADGVEMRCRACGARFPRRDAATPEKGSVIGRRMRFRATG